MNVWEFLGNYWWLVFPIGAALGGVVSGWGAAFRKWDERRRKHKLELARIKYGNRVPAQDGEQERPTAKPASLVQETSRVIAEHAAVNQRWLSYELDLAKLIDFPVMSDMREQVTIDFHRAKRTADALQPDRPDDVRDERILREYRDAVREFAVTFEIAEREAKRRRATDFTPTERQSLERAKRFLALAEDSSATHAERQQAYRRTQRELTGLIAVPDAADEALRHRIAGALDAPRHRDPQGA